MHMHLHTHTHTYIRTHTQDSGGSFPAVTMVVSSSQQPSITSPSWPCITPTLSQDTISQSIAEPSADAVSMTLSFGPKQHRRTAAECASSRRNSTPLCVSYMRIMPSAPPVSTTSSILLDCTLNTPRKCPKKLRTRGSSIYHVYVFVNM